MSPAKVERPRIRNNAGQYSARGAITAKMIQRAYRQPIASPGRREFEAARGTLVQFDACGFAPENVDKVNAVIRGVSVITGGLIARGHDLEVDETTLKQMKLCAEEKGQVPVKVDHKSGAAAVCGYLTGFRIEGAKLKADWHLLQSHPQKEQILETAERMPRGVGLSAAFLSPEKPETAKSGRKAARCNDLLSVDYVTLPAANPDGMFEAKVDTPSSAMNPEQIQAAIKAAVSEAIAPLTQKIDEQAKQIEALSAPQPSLEDLAQMDEAQLAELGLTPDDVQAALDELANDQTPATDEPAATDGAQPAATTDAPAAGAATANAGAPAGATAAALSALTKKVTELSARLEREDRAKKDAEVETLFSEIEGQVSELTELNTKLKSENEQLRSSLKAGGRAVSPGVTNFDRGNKNAETFLGQVELTMGEKKISRVQAFQTVMKEQPDLYRKHLVTIGVAKGDE